MILKKGTMEKKFKLTNYQIIILGYLSLILLGTLLLVMPFSSSTGKSVGFIDSLLTSTSALCVTGLVIGDTYITWSLFGQIVIILLIQIGGIGFMTIMTTFTLVIRGKLTLGEQSMLQQASGSSSPIKPKRVLKYVCLTTLIIEFTGTVLLSIAFCQDMPFGEGVYTALFTSISSFCNAGFDILGRFGAYSSLTTYTGNILVNFTVIFLIIFGGIGFLVYSDVIRNKCSWKKYSLNTKIVLVTTLSLILVGTGMYLLCEWKFSLEGLSVGEKLMASLFQSVTARTAGFNTVDIAKTGESGRTLLMFLMLIGGSPGSTAGGIKTTTFVVLIYSVISNIRRKEFVTIGKRRLENAAITQATAIFSLYILSVVLGATIICLLEPNFTLSQVMFEVVSAVATVGLSTGITSFLTIGSKIVIIFLMLGGRVGLLSLVMMFANKNSSAPIERPTERIMVG